MDPSSLEPKTHHRKRKHKHKSLDRTEDSSDTGPPPSQAKLPSDAYNFIREPPPSVVHVAPPSHTLTTPMVIQTNKGLPGPGHLSYPSMGASKDRVALKGCVQFTYIGRYLIVYCDILDSIQ